MRTVRKVAALSLALLFSACSKRPEPIASLPDDLQKDLVTASATASPLATAPQSYQRMRFVSDIERSRATTPATRPKVSRRHGGSGIGGILGGIAGAVIRGGHVGPDKCDPRTDGRMRGTITGRPDFTMPIPIGQPIFGRAGRR